MNTKISEVENKIPDTNSLEATAVLTTKIDEVESKIPDHDKYKNKVNWWIFCGKIKIS